MLDFGRFTHLTFDCYGTLVDWETGILEALGKILRRHGAAAPAPRLLELYARLEVEGERPPHRRYRDVLRGVVEGMGRELGFAPSEEELDELPGSLVTWPPFPDTRAALARLKARYKLVVVSNVDDDLFAGTAENLGIAFDTVITAQQVGSYKPSLENFRFALRKLGVDRSEVLHVAQSLYHDHVPAKVLGLRTVWVNRRSLRPGVGLAPTVEVTPDLEVPDLATLADAMEV
jgi:2-haloacid dehalogenase